MRTLLWALVLGFALGLMLGPLERLGPLLVLPPSYHLGLRILLVAVWLVGVVAIWVHTRPGADSAGEHGDRGRSPGTGS